MAATVLHGRRQGQSKSANNNHVRNEFSYGDDGEIALDIRSVKVLTKDEWNRIQNQVHRREIEEAERQKIRQEREDLKNRSKALVANWSNTVLGARQKKLAEREARLAKEEEERKAIDVDEEKFLAEKRRKAIEKAKIQQYYQTDRVKNFHSALLLTETLKEREAQIELKRLKARANDGNDLNALEEWRKEYEDALRKDQEKVTKRIHQNRETAAYQMAQTKQILDQRNKNRQEFLDEGEQIRRLAMAHALEAQRLDQIRHEEQRQLLHGNLQQIQDVKKMREIEKLKEAEDDEECRLFAAAKKKMLRMRMEREHQMHKDKQDSLDKIRAKLSAQMAAIVNDEEDRTQNAIHEREEKLAAEEAEKARKREEILASIKEHRLQQMHRADEEAKSRKKAEMDSVKARQEADALFRANEALKRERQADHSRRLAEYQQQQLKYSNDLQSQAREEAIRYDLENLKLVEVEENQFQDYAKRVIDHCKKNGRNVYPLERAAVAGAGGGLGPQFPGRGGVRPSYQTADQKAIQLPHYKRNTTEAVKTTIDNQESTHNRLGFVWG